MDFYGCNDIPLGSFLEKYCFKSSYMCPSETCETPMLDHERRFVHDGGCLHVTLKELDALPDRTTHRILLWSVCTACKSVSIVEVSRFTRVKYESSKRSILFSEYTDNYDVQRHLEFIVRQIFRASFSRRSVYEQSRRDSNVFSLFTSRLLSIFLSS